MYGSFFGFSQPESEVREALLEQFRRVANQYFLLISLLMLFGSYTSWYTSPLTPWSTLDVLIIVLAVSMGKEGVEDVKRHRADREVNKREVSLLSRRIVSGDGSRFVSFPWEKLSVGDVVRVESGKEIPADLVILLTSEAQGTAYVETSNIDGETNLKMKYSASTGESGLPKWPTAEDLLREEFSVECEAPNSSIHKFQGVLRLRDKETPLSVANLLLRGSSLRNTKWAIGLVVYTGADTKVVRNSRAAPSKLSKIEKTMNKLIYFIFVAQLVISAITLVGYIIWNNLYDSQLYYLCLAEDNSVDSMFSDNCASFSEGATWGYFLTFFILYNNFLPISLYVTVELCNYFQAYFIDADIEMYHLKSDTPAVARTSNMNADLGMVEYVFSDKTGTLTDNEMRFCRCSVGGVIYGNAPEGSVMPNSVQDDEGQQAPGEQSEREKVAREREKQRQALAVGQPLESVVDITGDLSSPLTDLVLAMALCHTVILDDSGSLQSESPDEEALVTASSRLGWAFAGREVGKVFLSRRAGEDGAGAARRYALLATVPFDSDRKRMSVLVRTPENETVVYTKGADNKLLEISASFTALLSSSTNSDPRTVLNEHLELFASEGLRTLVYGKRVLSPAEAEQFLRLWTDAEKLVVGKDAALKAAASVLEQGVQVIGATAIEDRLQGGVPQTIVDLGNAGIKLWVMTGDKMETAINIGYSSGLLNDEMVLIKLHDRGEKKEAVKGKLQAIVSHFSKLTDDADTVHRIVNTLSRSVARAFSTDVASISKRTSSDSSFEFIVAWFQYLIGEERLEQNDNPDLIFEDAPLLVRPKRTVELNQLTSQHLALIVDGETLFKIFGDPQSEQLLLTICKICKCVIGCRVSPEQKRLMVRLVKTGISPRPVTLSIGDGANDVAMIQEAQIGVGISGKEGRQAVNSSDFAIAQFRYLKRLMLVHGRLDYRRISKVVMYSFYKNIVLTFVLFAFTFFSGFSGQTLFDDYVYSAYNVILAGPVIAIGIFDRDISIHLLERYNILYVSGREHRDLNFLVLVAQMSAALLDSAIIYFIPFFAYHQAYDIWNSKNGYSSGLWLFGTTVYICLVLAMFVRAAMLTETWTWLTHLLYWGSLALLILFLVVYQYMYGISYDYYGITNEMSSQAIFWWLCLLVPSVSLLFHLTLSAFVKEFFPSIVEIGGEFDKGFGPDNHFFGAFIHEELHWSPEQSQQLHDSQVETGLRHFWSPDQFPLDWAAISNLFSGLNTTEQAHLGFQSSAQVQQEAAFNFDHVNYGDVPFERRRTFSVGSNHSSRRFDEAEDHEEGPSPRRLSASCSEESEEEPSLLSDEGFRIV